MPISKEKIYKKQRKNISKFRKYINEQFPEYTKITNHKHNKNTIVEGQEVVITEKIHGTNVRISRVCTEKFKFPWYKRLWNKFVGRPKGYFTVGSHHVIKWYDDAIYHRAAKQYGLDKLGDEWNGYIFYGEIYGKKIQHLSYGVPPGELRLAIFDIMYKNEWGQAHYLPWCEVVDICKNLNLPTVPELYIGPWKSDLVKLADGKSTIPGAKHHREGFVVKPTHETWNPKVGRLILKRISDQYLLGKNITDYH